MRDPSQQDLSNSNNSNTSESGTATNASLSVSKLAPLTTTTVEEDGDGPIVNLSLIDKSTIGAQSPLSKLLHKLESQQPLSLETSELNSSVSATQSPSSATPRELAHAGKDIEQVNEEKEKSKHSPVGFRGEPVTFDTQQELVASLRRSTSQRTKKSTLISQISGMSFNEETYYQRLGFIHEQTSTPRSPRKSTDDSASATKPALFVKALVPVSAPPVVQTKYQDKPKVSLFERVTKFLGGPFSAPVEPIYASTTPGPIPQNKRRSLDASQEMKAMASPTLADRKAQFFASVEAGRPSSSPRSPKAHSPTASIKRVVIPEFATMLLATSPLTPNAVMEELAQLSSRKHSEPESSPALKAETQPHVDPVLRNLSVQQKMEQYLQNAQKPEAESRKSSNAGTDVVAVNRRRSSSVNQTKTAFEHMADSGSSAVSSQSQRSSHEPIALSISIRQVKEALEKKQKEAAAVPTAHAAPDSPLPGHTTQVREILQKIASNNASPLASPKSERPLLELAAQRIDIERIRQEYEQKVEEKMTSTPSSPQVGARAPSLKIDLSSNSAHVAQLRQHYQITVEEKVKSVSASPTSTRSALPADLPRHTAVSKMRQDYQQTVNEKAESRSSSPKSPRAPLNMELLKSPNVAKIRQDYLETVEQKVGSLSNSPQTQRTVVQLPLDVPKFTAVSQRLQDYQQSVVIKTADVPSSPKADVPRHMSVTKMRSDYQQAVEEKAASATTSPISPKKPLDFEAVRQRSLSVQKARETFQQMADEKEDEKPLQVPRLVTAPIGGTSVSLKRASFETKPSEQQTLKSPRLSIDVGRRPSGSQVRGAFQQSPASSSPRSPSRAFDGAALGRKTSVSKMRENYQHVVAQLSAESPVSPRKPVDAVTRKTSVSQMRENYQQVVAEKAGESPTSPSRPRDIQLTGGTSVSQMRKQFDRKPPAPLEPEREEIGTSTRTIFPGEPGDTPRPVKRAVSPKHSRPASPAFSPKHSRPMSPALSPTDRAQSAISTPRSGRPQLPLVNFTIVSALQQVTLATDRSSPFTPRRNLLIDAESPINNRKVFSPETLVASKKSAGSATTFVKL